MSVPEQRPTPRWLALLFALTCAGLVFGLWALYPHLVEEHGRLEWWQAALIWTGDVVALFWFVRYFVAHCCWGRPLAEEAAGPGGTISNTGMRYGIIAYGVGPQDHRRSPAGTARTGAARNRHRHHTDHPYRPAARGGVAGVRTAASDAGKSAVFAHPG